MFVNRLFLWRLHLFTVRNFHLTLKLSQPWVISLVGGQLTLRMGVGRPIPGQEPVSEAVCEIKGARSPQTPQPSCLSPRPPAGPLRR